jgi:hypothetical protein
MTGGRRHLATLADQDTFCSRPTGKTDASPIPNRGLSQIGSIESPVTKMGHRKICYTMRLPIRDNALLPPPPMIKAYCGPKARPSK